MTAKKALIVVDVQNDFCKGGALEVPQSEEIFGCINTLIQSKKFDFIVFSQDWHPQNHQSFAAYHQKKVGALIDLNGIEQILWPVHCVQHSEGAALHKALQLPEQYTIVQKGQNPMIDSYSAFQNNDKKNQTELNKLLQENKISEVHIVGLALDYCVKYTCVDALEHGYEVHLYLEGTRAVNIHPTDGEQTIEYLKNRGVKIHK